MNYIQNAFMGYRLFNDELNNLSFPSKTIINTINQYSFCIAEEDEDFKSSLKASDVLLPDGIGIVAALKAINGQEIKKTTGADLHDSLLYKLNREKGKCFYLGSNKSTLKKIKNRLMEEYPDITCEVYSPPFKTNFSDKDNTEMIDAINLFKPDALFVGMSAPKQEKWVHEHKNSIDAKVICSIGAVFDYYAGTVKRASPLMINLGLEWFVRLCKEPKRLGKRYLYYGPIFALAILKEKLYTDQERRSFLLLEKEHKL